MRHLSYFACSFALATAACDSGHWVDVPAINEYMCKRDEAVAMAIKLNAPISASLPAPTPDEVKKSLESALTMRGQEACGKAGATFTGDSRCENGAGQVKCK